MSTQEPFDPLIQFAEIERLVSKIYFCFSHLFFAALKLRDFWWEMAKEEEPGRGAWLRLGQKSKPYLSESHLCAALHVAVLYDPDRLFRGLIRLRSR